MKGATQYLAQKLYSFAFDYTSDCTDVPGIVTLCSTVINSMSITIPSDKTTVGTKPAWTHNIQLKIELKITIKGHND